jgi:hypothetical protein
MSTHLATGPLSSLAAQADAASTRARAPRADGWPFDKPLPSVLTAAQLMQILGLRKSAFYRHQKAGRYRALEIARPVGVARYSGYLVDRLRRGEPIARIGAGSRRAIAPRRHA